ncbi:ABC transporter permease [Atopobium sp. oral taxon 416]|uniref:ABC transporter permease n=1 Tax=Atopobium sp. oral taxon 416 TaxID=712157 RepID=UPI001BA44822|nr:ABC transporter permease [Atopobium sp. oral taxon 416]QUC03702.1 ABC transporter permease [Atopobium sp. oral taxon 416]
METTNDLFRLSTASHEEADNREYTNYSFARETINRFLANKGATVAVVIIFLIILLAIICPMLSPYTYYDVDSSQANLPPRIPGIEQLGIFDGTRNEVDYYATCDAQDAYHYFGTDSLGRDIWTRVWCGTRISLAIALVAVIVDVAVGVVYGLVSGYFGGKVDLVMQRICEILSSIPQLVIVTLMIVVLQPGLGNIVIALFITGWIDMSRIVRAQVLKLRNQEFVLAARTLGVKPHDIILKEILPNTLAQIVVTFMFSIPNAIFLEAFLAFVGLGVPAPTASLGTLINDGYKAATIFPYQVVAPVVVLAVLMLGFNLFGDGLRDAIDPERS